MKYILIRYTDYLGELVENFFEGETVDECCTKFQNSFLEKELIPECFEIYELIGYHDPYNDK